MSARVKFSLLMACVCGFTTIQSAQAFDLANATADLTFTNAALPTTNGQINSMHYRVFLPDGYMAGQSYPVVMYLNSAAERGNTTAAIFDTTNGTDPVNGTNPWLAPLIQETQHGTHKAIVITPESGWYQYWANATAGENWDAPNYTTGAFTETNQSKLAMGILNLVKTTYTKADANRVYLTGPSMGGWGTWDMLARYPTTFAAGVPLSGGGNITAASTTLKNKPIWAFHGATDTLIVPSHSTDLVNAMNAADGSTSNGNPVYSLVQGVGHGGWDTFYTPNTYHTGTPNVTGGSNGQDLYDWMFSKTLAVPEPASLGLLAVGALALLRRKSSH